MDDVLGSPRARPRGAGRAVTAVHEGLTLEGLTKRFEEHVAVDDVSFHLPRARILALLGPSGSGKTTTLRLIAGFERPDMGTVTVDGRDVTALGPAQRRFGMVFQNYALFPHLSVGENVGFGLGAALSPKERVGRVAEALALVDLGGFESRNVTELSGGQQQRVAVARAIAPRPPVLLFDEPLSNLDPALRERTRRELRLALDTIGVTTVFVTHEQEEAFALGDVVAVLRDGALQQIGPPPDLYERPATVFVASFVGKASILRGRVVSPDRVEVMSGVEWMATSPSPIVAGQSVAVTVRPDALHPTDGPGLPGVVAARRYTGARAFFEVETEVGRVEFEGSIHSANVGDHVQLAAATCRVFPEQGL